MNITIRYNNLSETFFDVKSLKLSYRTDGSKSPYLAVKAGLENYIVDQWDRIDYNVDPYDSLIDNFFDLMQLGTNLPIMVNAHRRSGKTTCIGDYNDLLPKSDSVAVLAPSYRAAKEIKAVGADVYFKISADTLIGKPIYDYLFVDEYQAIDPDEINLIAWYAKRIVLFGTEARHKDWKSKGGINLIYPLTKDHDWYDEAKSNCSARLFKEEYLLEND